MVFGDGGEFLNNFTGCIDVIGHELTHAVTEHTSPLDYQGQPGALNEHVSDVFGIMVKQKVQDETADKADWLVGEDCILPGVKGVALRSMKAPGTAYDDPRFVSTSRLVSCNLLTVNRAKIRRWKTCRSSPTCTKITEVFTFSPEFPTKPSTWLLLHLEVTPGKKQAKSGGRR